MAHTLKSKILPFALLLLGCTHGSQSATPHDVIFAAEATRVDRPDLPLEHASTAELARFAAGDDLFESTFREADGLGPLYVRASCSACHSGDARGPGRVGKLIVKQSGLDPSALLPLGATLRPYVTHLAKTPLLAPKDDARIGLVFRFPPAVYGRGYLEAVDDSEIEKLAIFSRKRTGSIKGRIHRVAAISGNPEPRSNIGRFGLKARLATLEELTADAFHSDMGITSPMLNTETENEDGIEDDDKPGVDISHAIVQQVADYVRMLEIPRRKAPTAEGAIAFVEAQCALCHVPTLRTRTDYGVKALAGVDAPVFTDFLLHDMGERLADGPSEGDASAREWRTAPLIGLRFMSAFLHDGRAKTLRDAVLAHAGNDSEARDSIARFVSLPIAAQNALLSYIAGL